MVKAVIRAVMGSANGRLAKLAVRRQSGQSAVGNTFQCEHNNATRCHRGPQRSTGPQAAARTTSDEPAAMA